MHPKVLCKHMFNDVMVLQLFYMDALMKRLKNKYGQGKHPLSFVVDSGDLPFATWLKMTGLFYKVLVTLIFTWLDLPAFFLRETGYPASCSSFFLLI